MPAVPLTSSGKFHHWRVRTAAWLECIRVGLLFNPARVSCPDRGQAGPEDRAGILFSDGQPRLTLNPGRIDPRHPAFTGDEHRHWAPSRKPLAVELTWEGRRLFLLICHFEVNALVDPVGKPITPRSSVTSRPKLCVTSPPTCWFC